MKKYPFVKQSNSRDCAGACLLMILKFYGGYVRLDKLNYLLCTNNHGTTAFHMVSVLKSLGFEAFGYKFNDLSSLSFPCIALITKNSYNHYIVVYEVDLKRRKVLIGDPAIGITSLRIDEFSNVWTGIIIKMKPNHKVVKEKEPKVLSFILRIIKNNKGYLFLLGLLSLLISGCVLLFSFFIQGIITYVNSDSMFKLVFIFMIIFVLKILLNYIRNLLVIKFKKRIDTNVSMDMFFHIINLPYHYRAIKTTGEVISYFNDLSLIKEVISTVSYLLFLDFPLIIVLLLFFLFTDFHLFIICVFVLNILFLIHLIFRKKIYYNTSLVLNKRALINSNIVESISGFETVKGLYLENVFLKKFKNKYLKYLNISSSLEMLKANNVLLKDFASGVLLFLLAIYSYFSLKSGIPSSMIVTIFSLSTLLTDCFNDVLNFDMQFQNVVSTIHNVEEVFLEDNYRASVSVNGDIVIRKLSFSFDEVSNVLENVNLSITEGSKVLITGQSGCGKSTLCKLIKGYYDNYSGTIKIGDTLILGKNISNVVYVSDKGGLFTGNLADNLIRIGDDICEISSFADESFIIEEDGFNLSSGQKQRLSLARALTNFSILIIDEGLNQVDVSMERRILKNLFTKYKNKTIIFVSHRIDNLDLFDRLLKFENGRVVLDNVCR